MIGFVRGRIAGRNPENCLIDVSGVGYKLHCSSTTLSALPPDGDEAVLWTHVYVREDALALYGFGSETELKMFEALLGVATVGPKMALQICSAFSPQAFRKAMVTDDVAAFSGVSGVGKKTAQRIILELKEKLDLPDLAVVGTQPDAIAKARSALENLGYLPGEVRVALGEVAPTEDDSVEEVIKSALKALA